MEKEVLLTKQISIDPVYMTGDILRSVIFLFRNKYENSCLEDVGLILKINEIVSIDNVIGKDSSIINFSVLFKANVIKPEKNMKVSFKPVTIAQRGILGRVYDNIVLFIPENELKNWEYNDDCFKKSKKIINKNETINAIITDFKFSTNKYNCVCKLDEDK